MNPHFIGTLELIPRPDGRDYRLAHPFGYWSELTGPVHVPREFVTDLASVPQIFWNILPPFGKYQEAAVVHDYLYRTHLFSRYIADRVLLAGMKVRRVPGWQRFLIFWAVRLFGWGPWNNEVRRVNFIHHSGRHSFGRK